MLEQINIIIGLPGSGKSYYLKDKKGFILDDKKDFLSLPDYNDIEHKIMYIAHPMLCLEKYQNLLINNIKQQYGSINFNFYCFENNPIECLENTEKRDNKTNMKPTIKLLYNHYHFPKQYTPLKVFKPSISKNNIGMS